MLVLGLILILFAIWTIITSQLVVIKTIGAIAGIIGAYLTIKFVKQ